jgi:hypothetical protein
VELCEFIDQYLDNINGMKVLMIVSPNTYAILMKFVIVKSNRVINFLKKLTFWSKNRGPGLNIDLKEFYPFKECRLLI